MPLFTILTLFPEAVEPFLACGLVGQARERGLFQTRVFDFRDFARDRHRSVDDRPYGGGPGMLLRPDPILECVEWVEGRYGPHRRIAMCPSGDVFRQEKAHELLREERVLLLCGRYEGFDERIFELGAFERLSIGDFVLNGGELAALCVLEASVRLLPGVLGDERSAAEDSFQPGVGLDHPHYTRPRVFRDQAVPEVLLGGDHAAIRAWREGQAKQRTTEWRPELAPRDKAELGSEDNGGGTLGSS